MCAYMCGEESEERGTKGWPPQRGWRAPLSCAQWGSRGKCAEALTGVYMHSAFSVVTQALEHRALQRESDYHFIQSVFPPS